MQTLLQLVEALAWPAALIFLALQFQREIVAFCLRYTNGNRDAGGTFAADTDEPWVNVDRVREYIRETRGAELPDEEFARRLLDCVMSAEELSELRALSGGMPGTDPSTAEENSSRHVLDALVARGYVLQDANGRYKLSPRGEGVVHSQGASNGVRETR